MNDKPMLTQKDLDLVPDDEGAESGIDESKAAEGGDTPEDQAADKAADAKPAKDADGGGILDGLDDDDDDGAAAKADTKDSKAADAEKKDGKDADKKADKEAKAEGDEDEGDKDPEDKGDWRDTLVATALKGMDTKLTAAQLKKAEKAIRNDAARYKTEAEYMAAGYAARQKIRSGEFKAPRPADGATPEELKEWRKQNDIPETPDGYAIGPAEGQNWTDTDKAIADSFKPFAHGANFSQEQVRAAVAWQQEQSKKIEEEMQADLASLDRETREAAYDDIRTRYGVSELKPILHQVDKLLKDPDVLPDGKGNRILEARYYDPDTGKWPRLFNDADILDLFKVRSDYEYGEGSMVNADEVVRSNNRKAELEKLMETNFDEYIRSGGADELLEINRKEDARNARRGSRQSA